MLLDDCLDFILQLKPGKDASVQAASVLEFKPEPTAEIDVELSDGESNELQQTMTLKNKHKEESDEEPLSEYDYSYKPGDQCKPGETLTLT